ncbi:MAG: HAMP domain-containing sensor histidine kinase, partial [Thermomicrobiales bacterium]
PLQARYTLCGTMDSTSGGRLSRRAAEGSSVTDIAPLSGRDRTAGEMTATDTTDRPYSGEPSRYLTQALSRLRWTTIAALLLLTLLQPTTGRAELPSWALVLLFAGYNGLCQWLQITWPVIHSFARQAMMDLPAIGLIYAISAQPGGAPYVLVVLAVVCAAVIFSSRGTLLYTAAAAMTVAAIEPTLPMWSPTAGHVRELGVRIVGLVVVGIGTTILARHLTLEQAAARANRDEAERLTELDHLRVDFVATISHDLQTPLAATRVCLGLLDASVADRLRAEERELLDSARRNNQHLGLLIDDLLALNQLEAGTLRLDRQLIDLRAIVADAPVTIHSLLENKGQTLEIDLPVTPLTVVGDARRLGQVLVNLLANAHRHTPTGTGVVVSGRATGTEVILTVSDNGPGIAPEDLETVFRRFHRLAAHGEGSGLGLTIVRELIELHGGRIWAESTPGQGSVFHVALPKAIGGGAP